MKGQKSQGAVIGECQAVPRRIEGIALVALQSFYLVEKQVMNACSRRRRNYRSSLEAIMALRGCSGTGNSTSEVK